LSLSGHSDPEPSGSPGNRDVIYIGVDVGSIGIKAAAVGSSEDKDILEKACCSNNDLFRMNGGIDGCPVLLSKYQRILGQPARMMQRILDTMLHQLPHGAVGGIRITGAGGQSLAKSLGLGFDNELNSLVRGVGAQYPGVRTIIEMGGNSSKYIRVSSDMDHRMGILDYEKNGDCAAGTGSFMDQQASRLQCTVEEIGGLVLSVGTFPTIAGRCTVFSKTDMIHAQQRGYAPAQILKGLCEAVVRNFKGTVFKGKSIVPPVIVVGGMAANSGIIQAIQDVFGIGMEDLIVPSAHSWLCAIGAGLNAAEADGNGSSGLNAFRCLETLEKGLQEETCVCEGSPALSMDNLVLLRDRVDEYSFHGRTEPVEAYLGIDVGSVSTNLAVLDAEGNLIHSIYMRTNSRPIEVVRNGLTQIWEMLADKIRIRGVGTTGSGRDLIGSIVGADAVYDEITAHKTGATYVSNAYLNSDVDTIFEIGGQDAKFIRLEKGVVVDFSMNEACSAGTGSFLEEQAERLDIKIETEFASLALGAKTPTRLGERCTVFMEKDLINHLQQGADKSDLAAGLAYSIALNYLNRVVQGRKIGDVIFFQGGVAYNDAVAAAFSSLLRKKIVVPPYNGVIGAIGVALLACRKIKKTEKETGFRGYDLSKVDYELREHTCQGCSNSCTVQEIRVEKERTYWGDKCSNKFRRRPKTNQRAVVSDLISLREELFNVAETAPAKGPKIGIPRCMYSYDFLPFWRTYFHEIGCTTVLSEVTNRKLADHGIETAMAEPCFPIQVAHGHVRHLGEQDLDYIFVPNLINVWSTVADTPSYLCPWGQTLPFVLASARALADIRHKFLMPTIRFREGMPHLQRALSEMAAKLGISRRDSNCAVQKALERQRVFTDSLIRAGAEALQCLNDNSRMGIVLVARPYTLYDSGINMDLPRKLRDIYGINLIPMDFLDLGGIDIGGEYHNMFWDYGRKILQAARYVGENSHLHIIFMTNFKCGPDSFIHHYVESVSGKPFLVLQLDGHGGDAGAITRCEAYLESKGFLQ
jgi:predicted CoA-substrate-specific enzyme activase